MSLTAPGLTCTRCTGELYPHEARRTDDGWRHANGTTCLRSAQALVRAERLEDLRWMAETGECFTRAAKRLDMSYAALERLLRAHGRDLMKTLMARDPLSNTAARRARQKDAA